MKLSIRTLFYLLAIPIAGALCALLLAGFIPLAAAQDDIAEMERDLAYATAMQKVASAMTEQSREAADYIVIDGDAGSRQAAEFDVARNKVAVNLEAWRQLAFADGGSSWEIWQRAAAAHKRLTVITRRVVALVAEERRDEAARLLMSDIQPLLQSTSAQLDAALVVRYNEIAAHVARVSGGVHYARALQVGNLEEDVEVLSLHLAAARRAATFRTALERESCSYWFYLLSGRNDVSDIAISRQRSHQALLVWREALTDYVDRSSANPAQELAFVDHIEREQGELRFSSEGILRLLQQRSDEQHIPDLFEASLEFDEQPIAGELENHVRHELDAVHHQVGELQHELTRMRSILHGAAALTIIIGVVLPLIVSRRMVVPLLGLQSAAERIGRGDLETRVDDSSIREIASVARTFNKMTGDLAASRENLRLSEERFQLAARATNDALWDLDVRSGLLWVSDAFRAQYGDFPEYGPGGRWELFVHPEDFPRVVAGYHQALQDDSTVWAAEYRFRRRDDSYALVYDRAFIVRDADGVAIRVIGAIADLTARKDAERSIVHLKQQKEMILDSVGDGILTVDRFGTIVSANPAAAHTLGMDADRLAGLPIRQVLHRRSRKDDEPPAIFNTIRRGTLERSDEESFLRPDGTSFPVEYTSNAMHDEQGELTGAVLAFRDITHRQEIDRLKSQFVSTVSHELRTPLTSIRGALGLLRSGMLGSVNEKGQRMLEIAVVNTDRLVRLINEILDIERLDSGQLALDLKPLPVQNLIQHAVDVMRPMAQKSGITLHLEPVEDSVSADEDRIIQTLTNLLSNAIKFSPADTTITVRAERAGNAMRISVADQGRGIPADKFDKIFERFQQVDASDSRDKGGTGLGLAICRSIVQQHGGRIWVESTCGVGSTFSFTLPRILEDEPRQPGNERTILVCDDDASVRQVLKALLESRGYDVRTADSGAAALDLARSEHPRVILLDLLMPGMNGWEVMAELKASPATCDIPVLIASVLSPAEAEQLDGRTHDAALWVERPLDEERLFEALERVTSPVTHTPSLLIVEDDLGLANVLKTTFQASGIHVTHAADGFQAVELARRKKPDLLVLDIALPQIDGYDVVRWMRREPQLQQLPVVVYSGTEIPLAERGRLELGATEFFVKSRIPPEEFERKVLMLVDAIVDGSVPPHQDEEPEMTYVQARAAHR